MNRRHIGLACLLLGVLILSLTIYMKARQDALLQAAIDQAGTCFLEDGTCLHAELWTWSFITLLFLEGAFILFGGYLLFLDRSEERLAQHQQAIAATLARVHEEHGKDSSFQAYLEAFTPEEQHVLKLIRKQEGIKQNTLRIKAGMSKTALSLLLKRLEGDGVVRREQDGKTNKVYLTKF